jgi:hypothetical protein
MSARECEHDERDRYPDGECPQHLRFLPSSVAGRGTATLSVPRTRRWLAVAGNCLVGVTRPREVVAC